MSTATTPLTPKQQAFVAEYIVDKNGTQAAIRAGYSEKTAQEQASRLLSNVMVQNAIEELLAKAMKRNETMLDRWTRRIWEEADDFSEFASHSSRVRALEVLAKHYGFLEANNRQKYDPVTELVKTITGTVVGPRGINMDDDEA
ncbi:terminase small subunit [Ottowia sp.]|uniref:terminase small subunit n=1 Tax=Ottowia sp. TaxID=1898956 RepID=UPI002C164A5D|nr:terminase small subunit [Ottowia sp.]HRN77172.1 terminase small subunit [Ottowia sp.]HRQ04162.1 terminase small subunit [Ottowia sp.]